MTLRTSKAVGGRKMSNLRVADNIDLIAGSLAELTAHLDDTTSYGMEIIAEKSKGLSMGTKAPQPDITMKSGTLGVINAFKYLGSIISKDCRSTDENQIQDNNSYRNDGRIENIVVKWEQ